MTFVRCSMLFASVASVAPLASLTGCSLLPEEGFWLGRDRPLSALSALSSDELLGLCERESEAQAARVVECPGGVDAHLEGVERDDLVLACVAFVDSADFTTCDATTGDLIDAIIGDVDDGSMCDPLDAPLADCLSDGEMG